MSKHSSDTPAPDGFQNRDAMLASMRRTLILMQAMGARPEMLLDVLEVAARELRTQLGRSNANH